MGSSHRILIVDDEEAIRILLSSAFSLAGYRVRTAANGAEAIALCAHETFDVILSDIMMPEMNGHELAQWIASHYPQIRTVLMSGFDVGCQGCPYIGNCLLIAKPFRPSDAIQAVQRALAA